MKTKEIESIGVLLKEETLQTVEHYVLENTLVLESIEPFPGYHGQNMPKFQLIHFSGNLSPSH
jgi:hypothetical protein